MSHKVAPSLHRRFFASRSRIFLCLVAIAATFMLLNHLFKRREVYTLAQRISHPLAVVEDPSQSQSVLADIASPHDPEPPSEPTRLLCQSLQGLDDIFLVVRTGASEALQKLTVHFNTTLRCLPEDSYGIWSDLEETIHGHYVGDALNEVSPGVVDQHPDFDYYKQLKENGREAFSAEEIAAWASAPNSGSGKNTPGWKLDKWKFLPLAKKAYQQRPDAKWFIFTECDGYINWTSFMYWLSRHDPSMPYVGQLMIIEDVEFAYGGASFVISNAAMKSVTERYMAEIDTYEDYTGHHWAGDCVLGKALKDVGVDFTQAWPTFYSESPFDMDYNSSVTGPDSHLWCYHAMTWHHLSPSDIEALSSFEEKWNLEVIFHSISLEKVPNQTNQLAALDFITSCRCLPPLGDAEAQSASGWMG
ncbi:hypothetical protein JX266_003141 [Neoarthrinium moseri]|nr:hypothetical protein JX266_003141 [Neoarthrinium moseri]